MFGGSFLFGWFWSFLAAPGLSCSLWEVRSSLCHAGSLVVAQRVFLKKKKKILELPGCNSLWGQHQVGSLTGAAHPSNGNACVLRRARGRGQWIETSRGAKRPKLA